jgi:hypothetical protein
MKHRIVAALIALCWAVVGCGGEAEEQETVETGTAEQASIMPPQGLRYPDNFTVCFGPMPTTSASAYINSAIAQIEAQDSGTTGVDRFEYNPFRPGACSNPTNRDLVVNIDTGVPWVPSEYFHLSVFDEAQACSGCSGGKKRRKVLVTINEGMLQQKTLIIGITGGRELLINAAICRGFAASFGNEAFSAGNQGDCADAFSTAPGSDNPYILSRTVPLPSLTFPARTFALLTLAMQNIDGPAPYTFRGAAEL